MIKFMDHCEMWNIPCRLSNIINYMLEVDQSLIQFIITQHYVDLKINLHENATEQFLLWYAQRDLILALVKESLTFISFFF